MGQALWVLALKDDAFEMPHGWQASMLARSSLKLDKVSTVVSNFHLYRVSIDYDDGRFYVQRFKMSIPLP
jgi:hypothetical protein